MLSVSQYAACPDHVTTVRQFVTELPGTASLRGWLKEKKKEKEKEQEKEKEKKKKHKEEQQGKRRRGSRRSRMRSRTWRSLTLKPYIS